MRRFGKGIVVVAGEMTEAWFVDAVRPPIGRRDGSLGSVRPDDLAATVLEALMERFV